VEDGVVGIEMLEEVVGVGVGVEVEVEVRVEAEVEAIGSISKALATSLEALEGSGSSKQR